jgi:hypothetical protein
LTEGKEENTKEKRILVGAFLYNKKEAYEDEFKRTGHDERKDEVKRLIKRIRDHSGAVLDRRKKIDGVGIIYTQDVKFEPILNELFYTYELGFDYSTISLCGTIAERACYDWMKISKDIRKLDDKTRKELEGLDFRKLLTSLTKLKVIDRKHISLLHQIYDMRNDYVHLKEMGNLESDAISVLNKLCEVLVYLFDICNFYILKNGTYYRKDEYKNNQ